MAVDAVLFDLDETLVTYERPASAVLEETFAALDVEPFFSVRDFQARYDEFFTESDSIEDLRERIFAAIARESGHDPALGRRLAGAYADRRDHSRVSLLPGAPALLAALADRPLGLVTNGDPGIQRPKLAATGLDERFDTVVYAGHDAAPKPDPEPFERALSALDVRASEGVFVGNDPVADVGGAHRAGLRPVWIRNGTDVNPAVDPAITVECLDELTDSWVVG